MTTTTTTKTAADCCKEYDAARAAARDGCAEAHHKIGCMRAKGQGCIRSLYHAEGAFLTAAAQGYLPSVDVLFHLSTQYEFPADPDNYVSPYRPTDEEGLKKHRETKFFRHFSPLHSHQMCDEKIKFIRNDKFLSDAARCRWARWCYLKKMFGAVTTRPERDYIFALLPTTDQQERDMSDVIYI